MKNKSILILIVVSVISIPALGQLKFSGEFRPRTEYSHGYKTLAHEDQKSSLFTSQRTRLNLGYKAKGITTKLVLQDVRNWGGQKQLVTNEDYAISIHEAWAEAQLGSEFALKLGRQELVYDNHRIFGNVGWAHQGRSHDLALLKYKGFLEAHLGIAYNESGERDNNFYHGPDAYKFMQFLWLNHAFGQANVSFLFLNNGVPDNSTNDAGEIISQEIVYTQTLGPTVVFNLGSITLSGNAYFQTGTLASGADLSAYEYLLQVDWKASSKLALGASFETLSGTNSDEEEAGSKSFTPFYGTNHKFNGHMDYFYVGNHGGSVGLNDLTGRIKYSLGAVNLGLDVHGFWASADMPNSSESYLGTEFDFSANHSINSFVKMTIGYSHLLPTESMELLKGGDADVTQNWAWLMFTFTPTFLD